jgi:hypothetical protein
MKLKKKKHSKTNKDQSKEGKVHLKEKTMGWQLWILDDPT